MGSGVILVYWYSEEITGFLTFYISGNLREIYRRIVRFCLWCHLPPKKPWCFKQVVLWWGLAVTGLSNSSPVMKILGLNLLIHTLQSNDIMKQTFILIIYFWDFFLILALLIQSHGQSSVVLPFYLITLPWGWKIMKGSNCGLSEDITPPFALRGWGIPWQPCQGS